MINDNYNFLPTAPSSTSPTVESLKLINEEIENGEKEKENKNGKQEKEELLDIVESGSSNSFSSLKGMKLADIFFSLDEDQKQSFIELKNRFGLLGSTNKQTRNLSSQMKTWCGQFKKKFKNKKRKTPDYDHSFIFQPQIMHVFEDF